MPLADYHDMVKTFPPKRANHALCVGVLSQRAWRNDRLPDVQQPRLTRKSFAINLIPVPDQMPRALLLPARLDQLSRGPYRRRRSEEHTSELQSQSNLVCRLLLEK